MFRRTPWILGGLILLGGVASSAREIDDAWIRGIFTGKSPRPVVATESEAWQRAGVLAEHTSRAFVLVGSGESMQPLYAPGTILVLQQCAYAQLQPGQTALYRSHSGKIVGHVLVAKAHDGWRTAGLNNRIHDMEPVVAENFVGIVIAAFMPLPARVGVQVATLASR